MRTEKKARFDCKDGLSGYISRSSSELYANLNAAKKVIENVIAGNDKISNAKDLDKAVADIDKVKKFIEDLNDACMPWQDKVKKNDGMSPDDILKSYISEALKNNAAAFGSTLSFIIIDLINIEKVVKNEGAEKSLLIIRELDGFVRTCLRRRADFVIKYKNSIIVILPETIRGDAFTISERLGGVLKDYLNTKTYGNLVKPEFRVVSTSGEDLDTESLLKKIVR